MPEGLVAVTLADHLSPARMRSRQYRAVVHLQRSIRFPLSFKQLDNPISLRIDLQPTSAFRHGKPSANNRHVVWCNPDRSHD